MLRAFIAAFSSVVMLLLGPSANAGLDEELVFYFTFDNVKGRTIIDESGNGLDAEILENTEIVKGKYGDGIRFIGQGGNCVNIPSQEKLKVIDEITMMLWVYYPTSWKGKRTHFFDKDCHTIGAGASYGIMSADIGDGPKIWMFLGSPEGRGQLVKPHEMVAKKWHHVTGSCDGETMKIYVDGKIIGEEERKFNLAGNNDADVRIGCAKDRAHVTFMNGSIDEAAVWQRALSDNEIKQAMTGNFLAVSPSDKAATTWADMKRRAVTP